MSFIKSIRDTWLVLPREHRRAMYRTVALAVLQSFLEILSLALIIPLFTKLRDNDSSLAIAVNASTGDLPWPTLLGIIGAAFILKNLICLLIIRNHSNFISSVSVSLSEKLYRNFYGQSWTMYTQNNSAETVRKIKTTPSDFANYVLHGYIVLLSEGFTALLMVCVVVLFDYRVALIVLLLCLPVAVIYFLVRKKITVRLDKSFRELTPQTSHVLTQGVDSFAEAKIYHKENFFIDQFMTFRRITSQQLADLKTASAVPSRLFELAALLCLFALIIYANATTPDRGYLVTLIGLLSLAMYRIIPSMNKILVTLSQLEAYNYSVSEIQNAFDSIVEPIKRSEPIPFERQIELHDVSFQYSTLKWTIDRINLTIKKGDLVMLDGPSGAGKTTLLYLLAGLLKPAKGKILVDGIEFTPDHVHQFQKRLALVPQTPVILQDTVANNVAFGERDNIDYKKVYSILHTVCLSDFITSLPAGIETQLGENGLNLSGGQRQRVALARALYRNPDVLLLDEFTNQLDEVLKEKILLHLKEQCNRGTTIIIATHDQSVKKFASWILKM